MSKLSLRADARAVELEQWQGVTRTGLTLHGILALGIGDVHIQSVDYKKRLAKSSLKNGLNEAEYKQALVDFRHDNQFRVALLAIA